ncbi:imidazolonepropionase [Deminuibacter soli]|uniref:Imidazolonepropionase n=1 Tax=Deminuibacter soli TaxID=2291815 RepID=A0A3E1NJE4_9BACT|nr:imidazolonepropionase [Deminuibacter soli]RFM28056.1 imidazolonepropionase [Deminuibacter soli]
MSTISLINIGFLVNAGHDQEVRRGAAMAQLPVLEQAYLEIKDDRIVDWGLMKDYTIPEYHTVADAAGGAVLPGWCDSHTHLVFAASREGEFIDKLKGLSYEAIAAKGGGILNSARKLNATDENTLYELAKHRLESLMQLGTTAIEIKSGYGLTLEGELKMLRVIQRLKQSMPIPVKATFLGAHAFPEAYKNNPGGYIRLITEEMLPAIAAENLADYIDVFCEQGFFNTVQTAEVCNAGAKYGLKAKIHANQLHVSGGVETGVALGAVSVDHLESMDHQAIQTLAASNTIGTLLPTAAFFLRMPFQPARQLIDAGCAVALASDFNPGSSPSGNMNLVVSMACIGMKMLPEEAINAATINGAHAMGLGYETGSIARFNKANLILTQPVPSIAYLPYAFGTNLVKKVMVNGNWI